MVELIALSVGLKQSCSLHPGLYYYYVNYDMQNNNNKSYFCILYPFSCIQESSQFLSLFNNFFEKVKFIQNNIHLTEMIDLDLTETFDNLPDAALKNIRSRDINIIVGFFGAEKARRVLCKVSL